MFGIPHERLGEEVVLAVVTRDGMTIDEDELKAFLGAHLAPFKIPTRIISFAEPLPRNPAGKILKRDLRDQFADPN